MESHTFLVAGGNTGIAASTLRHLVEQDHSVICAARRPEAIDPHPKVQAMKFDATDADSLPELPDSLDGLVYCPGTINLKPFHSLSDEDFLNDLEVNLLGAIRLIRHALPALKKSAHSAPGIVLFSTVAVHTGMPYHASIAAAKGAVEGLARSLAAELSPKIRVNVIAPSLTNTPLAERLIDSDEKRTAAEKRHPMQQVGNPDDVAASVAHLLSEHARFITGQVLRLDGGMSSVKKF
jgi:NAD(P)-dependent dehydrogenase (short-subunit alcohol dehydrogenase family)